MLFFGYINFFTIISLFLWMSFPCYAGENKSHQPSVSFFYGNSIPTDVLSQFDRIIVEADNIKDEEIQQLQQHGARVYAYLSIGESNPNRDWSKTLSKAWILGENSIWQSQVMDLSHQDWQQFLVERAQKLQQRGFQGFFLDTLDSYLIFAKKPKQREKQQQGLINILKALYHLDEKPSLIANRGFEVIDQIAPYLEAVAAESLYQGWNNENQQYEKVNAEDRQWLKEQLSGIQQKHSLNIIAIDYPPPTQREQARQTAQKTIDDGFTPWIANPALNYVGIGRLEVIPRRVLMLYDNHDAQITDISETEIHRLLAAPIEYYGYIPEFHDLNQGLPSGILKGQYAGVVSWLNQKVTLQGYTDWLLQRFNEQTPVVFLSDIGVELNAKLLDKMGLVAVANIDENSLKITQQSDLIGFEALVSTRIDSLSVALKSQSSDNQVHLRMKDQQNREVDLALHGKWGGLVLAPALVDDDFNHDTYWILSPMPFIKQALQLEDMPVPDVTTENGRRLLLNHIDGDGFMSKAEMIGTPFGAQVILDEILKVYKIPHTVSIIEGEIGPTGLYPKDSPALEAIARHIFRQKNVEIASHSYSHPFKWGMIDETAKAGDYNLPIKNYKFDLEREIIGSVNYINKKLAPKNKKTKVFLWTGDTLPTTAALKLTTELGLFNMNGGVTTITKASPSLAQISGMSRHRGIYTQIYAPVLNENVYTNDWLGPYYGFRHVIETFEMTDKPYRFKPINIYYHFYSGTKPSALNALKEVYDWAMQQETLPLYASEFIQKANNYASVGIARKITGGWRIQGLKQLHTLRVPKSMGWPELSKQIAGVRLLHDGYYIHHNQSHRFDLNFQQNQPTQPYLYQSNAFLNQWENHNNLINFKLSGHIPILLEVAATEATQCYIQWQQGRLDGQKQRIKTDSQLNTWIFQFPSKETGHATLHCT